MNRLPLLPPRPLLGVLKTVASAHTTQGRLANGQLVMTIAHETLRGIAPPMLRWWFETLGGTMRVGDRVYPRYLLWHPFDHIHWEVVSRAPGGGSGQGARFRIVEAFGADMSQYVDSTEAVERLDDTGIALVHRLFGTEVFRLEHQFGEAKGGASYRSCMVVGAAGGLLAGAFNRWVRPQLFSDRMGTAWLRHNIEEVGLLEHLLPPLYAARGDTST